MNSIHCLVLNVYYSFNLHNTLGRIYYYYFYFTEKILKVREVTQLADIGKIELSQPALHPSPSPCRMASWANGWHPESTVLRFSRAKEIYQLLVIQNSFLLLYYSSHKE